MCTRSIWKENFQTCLGMNWWIFTHNYQFSLVTQSCPTPCDPMDCNTPGFPVHHQLLQLAQTHVHQSVMPTNHLILCCSPFFNLSQHQDLSKWLSSLHQMAKVLEFQLQHQSLQLIFRVDFFRTDSLDLLAGWGTLNSLLQHHTLKASILQLSAFFMVQFSHPYMTTGKTIALAIWTFISKVISLLFNMLWRFDISFLPRSKHVFISWLQSPSKWLWNPPK